MLILGVNEYTLLILGVNEYTLLIVGVNEYTLLILGVNEYTLLILGVNEYTLLILRVNEYTLLIRRPQPMEGRKSENNIRERESRLIQQNGIGSEFKTCQSYAIEPRFYDNVVYHSHSFLL